MGVKIWETLTIFLSARGNCNRRGRSGISFVYIPHVWEKFVIFKRVMPFVF